MSKVRIVTDSTSDIPQQVREKLRIEMVPLKVHFGEETFLDHTDIDPPQFYELLSKSSQLPTTSQPSPVDFMNVYKQLLEEDPDAEIISIHISASFSGTYQAAELAKTLMESKGNITIIDSKSASYGVGMIVVALAEAAAQGKNMQECLELYETLRTRSRLYFLVDTLDYLHKGGRIGKASAVLGSLLNIKPILSIDEEGSIVPIDKIRGQKKAMHRIMELLKDEISDTPVNVTIAHANSIANADQLAALSKESFQVNELIYTEIGPVIGTHAGPGTVAIFLLPVH